MSDMGYLQTKIQQQNEKVITLEQRIKKLEIKITSLENNNSNDLLVKIKQLENNKKNNSEKKLEQKIRHNLDIYLNKIKKLNDQLTVTFCNTINDVKMEMLGLLVTLVSQNYALGYILIEHNFTDIEKLRSIIIKVKPEFGKQLLKKSKILHPKEIDKYYYQLLMKEEK